MIPGPTEFPGTATPEQSAVKFLQSLLSVPEGPEAQGTHCNVALHPGAVTDPSEANLNVKHPLGSVEVKLNGVARAPVKPVCAPQPDKL